MEMLHTPEEIVRLSNAAHVAEGVLLIILAVIFLAKATGRLQKSWQRFLVPIVGLIASLTLAAFLFVDHGNELAKAWQAIMGDMQQKQHFYMGSLIWLGSIAEFIAIKRKNKLLRIAFPLAVASIGLLFIFHPQHDLSNLAQRALLIHRVAGGSLIISAVAQAMAVFKANSKKTLLIIAAVALTISGSLFISYREPSMKMSDMHHAETQGKSTDELVYLYELNHVRGKS